MRGTSCNGRWPPYLLGALALVAALVAPLAPGQASAQAPAPPQSWAGQQSGVQSFAVSVVRGEDAWRTLWSGLRREAPPRPQDIGIAIYLGLRNTGGFAVEIEKVEREGALTVVTFRMIEPDPDSFVTQVLTTPYVLARIADDGAPVAFRRAADGDGSLILPRSEVDRLNALIDELKQ